MAKKKAVGMWAVIRRINRELAAKGEILKGARRGLRMRLDCGNYYILDSNMNAVSRDVDPEKLARKLGVLKNWEEVRG